jgi:exocyst complex protein 7
MNDMILTDDIVTTTIGSLNTISQSKRGPFRPVFLLNNISYLRQNLLLEPSDDTIPSLIAPPTADALHSAFRTAKAAYFDSNLSPLMQSLTETPKDEKNKAVVKDKFTKFFILLDEIVERHRIARVLEDDPKTRKEIEDETVMLVVPSFRLFMQKHKEFSRSALIRFFL